MNASVFLTTFVVFISIATKVSSFTDFNVVDDVISCSNLVNSSEAIVGSISTGLTASPFDCFTRAKTFTACLKRIASLNELTFISKLLL